MATKRFVMKGGQSATSRDWLEALYEVNGFKLLQREFSDNAQLQGFVFPTDDCDVQGWLDDLHDKDAAKIRQILEPFVEKQI